MKIDPRHLEQIAAILEFGTLDETARQLGTSQPALSRMINLVEARVGAKLFERNSKPLVPTEIGKSFAKHGRSITAIRNRAFEDAEMDKGGMTGELKIGAPPFLCERLVRDVIFVFLKERPDASLKLDAEYFPELERRLRANQLDIAICPLRPLTSSKNDLIVEPLFEDSLVIVAARHHKLSKVAHISVQDLEAATWISHSEHSMLRADMAAALTSIGVKKLNIAFQSGSAGAIFEMLRNTDFLTVLPSYAIRRVDQFSKLCALQLKLDAPSPNVGMVTPGNCLKSSLQTAFEAHLKSYLAEEF